MPRKKIEPKKKRGRPRLQPQSAAALRAKAQAGVRAAAERRQGIHEIDVEDLCDSIDRLNGKFKFTRKEMDDMREKVEMLYQKFVVDKQEQEAEDHALFNEAARVKALMTGAPSTSGKQMTREDWCKQHGLRPNGKRKPGPKKKPAKKFYEVNPADYGMAVSAEDVPSLDLEEMETELYNQAMERMIDQQKEEQELKLCKRFRAAAREQACSNKDQDFWI